MRPPRRNINRPFTLLRDFQRTLHKPSAPKALEPPTGMTYGRKPVLRLASPALPVGHWDRSVRRHFNLGIEQIQQQTIAVG